MAAMTRSTTPSDYRNYVAAGETVLTLDTPHSVPVSKSGHTDEIKLRVHATSTGRLTRQLD